MLNKELYSFLLFSMPFGIYAKQAVRTICIQHFLSTVRVKKLKTVSRAVR